MPTTRFKGETAGERLDKSSISDSDMLQLRHKPGTIEDADKGISKAQLLSCPFGVSDTAAATAAKAASLTDSNPDFTLVSGREVVVCFTTANTASNPTLNFAGSGAIPLYRTNGEAVGSWPADTWMHLKYFYATVGNSTIQRWIVLSPLPVDEVAANNMNSVTSNAVSSELSSTMRAIDTYFTRFFTANTTVHVKDFVNKVVEVLGRGYKYITFGWSNGNQGYITDGNTSILMNGNFIMGYFRPTNDSVTFVYSHFLVCDINGNKVFHVWIRRDSIEITEGIDPLN